MNEAIIKLIAGELNLELYQVRNTIGLLEKDATVPFISRYRKEMTGSLDEVNVLSIKELFEKYTELEKRKETILKTIEEQGKLTDELKKLITESWSATELEDIYLPYKPKRKTRASIAREFGLEPLATTMLQQFTHDIEAEARKFITDKVPDLASALAGARDIVAEWVNEDKKAREMVRGLFAREAIIESKLVKGKAQDGAKFQDYFEFAEPLRKCPSHRLLAMRRGEDEGFLKLSIAPEEEKAIETLQRMFMRGTKGASEHVGIAVKDAYKRLIQPSIETEFRNITKEQADTEAIRVFAENLRQLLMAPPLGQKRILAIDPGFRTGCKVVCIDEKGDLTHNETIFPHPPQNEFGLAQKKIASLVEMYKIEAVAIGNGTAGRETESFIKSIRFPHDVRVYVVSENGASVYSASKIARDEFPQYDVTVRGAVSIGRRLMDPLAELVKIDPKSIGVGQYQHDVDQTRLATQLDQVVESCVNQVGVNLNTASKHLLTYVSGLGPQLAQNIVDYRSEQGAFTTRDQLHKVPRLGEKAFEQCAGFLRIKGAANPLDDSAVHPESYHVVTKMAKDAGCNIADLIKNEESRKKIDIRKYITETTGLPTLQDIMTELAKPGLDPRTKISIFEFSQDVRTVEDLRPGMELPGIVTNITNFGAFVDVGVKQDGLVHISQLADKFVKNPLDVVKLHQHIKVKVLEVDLSRKRIQLTMKGLNN